MYFLQNNVEIVKGARNHCIYNLNTQKLYNLDQLYLDYLLSIISDDYDNVPSEVVDFYLKEEIISDNSNLKSKLPSNHFTQEIEFAWIEITQNCNLICRHCYEGSTRAKELPQMSMQDFNLVVNELVNAGVKRIQLVGGEPLLHTNFKEMLSIATSTFEFVEVFTNGTLLTDELINQVKESGAHLAFSLYAQNAHTHDYVTRTKGSYELTSKNIDNVLNNDIPLRLAAVEMIDVPKYEYPNPNVSFKSDLPKLTGRADMSLYTRDMLLRKIITKKTFSVPINPSSFYYAKEAHNCYGKKVYIDFTLDVYPCVMERRLKHGNLHDKSLADLLNLDIMKMNKDKIDECKDCEFRYACFDCRPDSNNQPVTSKPWYCSYNPREGKWTNPDEFVDKLLTK